MGRRKRYTGIGLLILLLFLFSPGLLVSQDGEAGAGDTNAAEIATAGIAVSDSREDEDANNEADEVIEEEVPAVPVLELVVESSPANPVANSSWMLVIMVNHPNPSDVNVRPPDIPASLYLERVRIEARTVRNERWTRVEYLFSPRRAETITLAPFLVTVPGRQAETSNINVRFREPPVVVRRYEPRFRWLGTVPSVHTGTRGELLLELSDWNPDLNLPRGFFQGKAPHNAIVEESLPAEAGNNAYRYTISIIPLEGTSVALEALSFRSGTHALSVPALRIPVLPPLPENEASASNAAAASAPGTDPEEPAPVDEAPLFPFPESSAKVFPLFRGAYERTLVRTRSLWGEGRRAEALGEIRRNERDSLAGPFLAPLRREMEQVLGLGYTIDENWRPMKVHPLSWLSSFCLVIFTAAFLIFFRPRRPVKWKSMAFSRPSGLRAVFVLLISIGLAFIFFEEGLKKLLDRINPSGHTAVLERTAAYRIPNSDSAVNALFAEGQPVIVDDSGGEWRYAESTDGRGGWVPRDLIIIY